MKLSAYIEKLQARLANEGDIDVFGDPLVGQAIGGYSVPSSGETGTIVRLEDGTHLNVPDKNRNGGMGVFTSGSGGGGFSHPYQWWPTSVAHSSVGGSGGASHEWRGPAHDGKTGLSD